MGGIRAGFALSRSSSNCGFIHFISYSSYLFSQYISLGFFAALLMNLYLFKSYFSLLITASFF